MTLIVIPVRMKSSRLPGKPLLEIGAKSVLQHCIERAEEAGFNPLVAAEDMAIYDALPDGRCTFTGEGGTGGTDNVAKAVEIYDPDEKHKLIVNYQGDMPFLDPEGLKEFVALREKSNADIVTAYCEIQFVAISFGEFQRVIFKSHIGLYGYTREALRRYAAMPQSKNEIRDRLEQLRKPLAFTWEFLQFPSMPVEINTPQDLERARSCQM